MPYSQRYLFNAIPDINHNANPTNPNRYSKGNPNPTTLLTLILDTVVNKAPTSCRIASNTKVIIFLTRDLSPDDSNLQTLQKPVTSVLRDHTDILSLYFTAMTSLQKLHIITQTKNSCNTHRPRNVTLRSFSMSITSDSRISLNSYNLQKQTKHRVTRAQANRHLHMQCIKSQNKYKLTNLP